MARPRKLLFKKDGVFYARVGGRRLNTLTSIEEQAYRRAALMKATGKAWSEIHEDYDDQIVVTIEPSGRAWAETSTHTVENNRIHESITPSLSPEDAFNAFRQDKSAKPPQECKSIGVLIDYEYHLMEAARKPKNTLNYYRCRFDALRRYVNARKLDLDSFDEEASIAYPAFRLDEQKDTTRKLSRPTRAPTVNKEITFFRELWSRWRDEDRLHRNPWARVTPVKVDKNDGPGTASNKTYDYKQIGDIFSHLPDVVKGVCLLQAVLGARPGIEVYGITRTDVENSRIYNVKKKRWDPMHYGPEAIEIFNTIEGKMDGLTSAFVWKCFRKACVDAKVKLGSPYWLRHSFGTEARTKYSIEVVRDLLRQRDIKTTLIYSRVRDNEAAQAAAVMQKGIMAEINKTPGEAVAG